MPARGKVWIKALLTVGALMACGGTATAQATVIDSGHFSGTETGVQENLCGIDVIRDSVFSGSFRIRMGKRDDDQAFFERFNLKATDTFTNLENGESFSIDTSEVSNELKATRVSGNVFEFTIIEAGQPFVVRDSAGRIVLRDRGNIRRSLLFDTLGDSAPGGIVLDETVLRVSGPQPGFDLTDEQFCDMVVSLIG
jgi:hypothetical protein